VAADGGPSGGSMVRCVKDGGREEKIGFLFGKEMMTWQKVNWSV